MAKRVITSLVGLPILIGFVILGGFWLRVALLVLSLVGLFEFYRALSGKFLPIHVSGFLFSVLYFLLIVSTVAGDLGHVFLIAAIAAFILVTQAMLVIFYQKIEFKDCLITICGFFYVSFLFSFIYYVRDYSVYFVWLIFTSASASDTFAYLVGRKFGHHNLSGTPSPGKTWEGCLGGITGAALVGFLYGYILYSFVGIDHPIVLRATAVSVMGAIFSQFGDLFASAIKRSVGIKDFGKVLPGHGGVLDRFDSIIVAAPVVYIMMIWMLA